MRTLLVVAGAVVALFLTIAMLGTAGWTRPPMAGQQIGYRGTGMDLIRTRAGNEALAEANQAPAPADPVEEGGEKASAVYQNVKVLGDLSADNFNRLMVSMTEWVSPEQGCTYCHNTENMADDSLYQKRVARRMLQMTQHINSTWKEKHVHEAGVTCYTCHRGNPVPANIWFENPGPNAKSGFIARNNGQNVATPEVGLTSLPYGVYAAFYAHKNTPDDAIRVNAQSALPESKGKPIQDAEKTFALMISMSQSLGVNCTFCHNTRSVAQWGESTPNRVTAWHGIRMVRDLNEDYLSPLAGTFPPNRLGPQGDVPKVNCATCHNGANKPLNGAHVVDAYPELAKPVASADMPAGTPAQPATPPAAPPAPKP
ncbi:photosynthetic reaction center cytochrome PufC [Methylobacterium trifolii]|uniref:Photosynthetic reaction center cytochrome c subunit n=1 Tax=Methylobacterium trifolii TaxID=1003092 RepID=A0ABQ4U4M5_9HYPH|nr:photosynthetic reaction center cytochrome PufC [Methylobacterium trifolii]GJE61716.1 Photosynthetic reaction center cytochrome c subunit [Methylobacterium trifolii]